MDFHSINTLLVLAAVAGCVVVTVKLQGKIEFKSCIGYSKISKQTAALLPAAKNHSVVNIIGCKCRALIIHASLAQQAQENQSWFAGWRQGGLPGSSPGSPWNDHREHWRHWRQSQARGQQGHPKAWPGSLCRWILSVRKVWLAGLAELKALQYCNFTQQKWRAAPAKLLLQELGNGFTF